MKLNNMKLEDVILEYHLYDNYVKLKEGWELINLKKIDYRMDKQMEEYEVRLYCALDNTYWEGTFWDSTMNGVRNGYLLSEYIPEDDLYEGIESILNNLLIIWQSVNKTKTLEELSDVILSLADEDGMIQGVSYKFNAKTMADNCKSITLESKTMLTRNYGIRQQAIYLLMK